MNVYREENPWCCHFHPKEVIVGVCPLCLNERLLILAAKQGQHPLAKGHRRTHSLADKKKTPITLPKIFALGSFLNRLEFRHWKSDHDEASTSQEGTKQRIFLKISAVYEKETVGRKNMTNEGSQEQNRGSVNGGKCTEYQWSVHCEDSFISIKFEDNGVASWEKSTATKVPLQHCIEMPLSKEAKGTKSVVEHAKPRGALRWRKRIGHLFQLIRWKRSSKANVCHVGSKGEGVKVMRKGWIRSLTKRKTKKE